MMNLYYRGYVIHQDIRSICYTIFDCRPHRTEMASRGTALEAMRWVDLDVARRPAALGVDRDAGWRERKGYGAPAQSAVP